MISISSDVHSEIAMTAQLKRKGKEENSSHLIFINLRDICQKKVLLLYKAT